MYFYPAFILRRYLFVLIPILVTHSSLQLQLLLNLQVGYIVVYGIGMEMPHNERNTRRLEALNEAMLMCLFYHLMCFTNFVVDSDTSYLMSNSFLLLLGGTIMINFFLMFKDNVILAIKVGYVRY